MSSPSVSSLLKDLRASARAAQRVPVEIALGVFAAIVGSLAIENSAGYGPMATEAVLAVVPTLLTVFIVTALHEFGRIGRRLRWGLTLAVLGAGLGYGGFVLDADLVAEIWRWGMLTSALFFGAMTTPWLVPPEVQASRSTSAWLVNVRMGLRVVVAGLYTVALSTGTNLGLLAFNVLFELGLGGDVFLHVAVWIYAVGGTGLIATGLPKLMNRWAEEPPAISEGQKSFVYWGASLLALPLLGLYLTILYAYGGRILLTGDVPSNLLSPLALGAALLGLVALYLIEPLRQTEERQWLGTLFDAFPVAYLPVMPMPIWAIWVRVQQHGWTEFRYLRMLSVVGIVLCFGWAAGHVLRRRVYSTLPLPAVFSVLLLLAAVGPWGAVSVSEQSQVAHLKRELNTPAPDEASSQSNGPRVDAQRRIRYLFRHFGPSALRPVLPDDHDLPSSVQEAQNVLGAGVDDASSESASARTIHAQYSGPISVPAAGTVRPVETRRGGGSGRLAVDGLSLVITLEGGGRDTVSLTDRLPDLQGAVGGGSGGPPSPVPESLMTFQTTVAGQKGQLVFRRLLVRSSPAPEETWYIRVAEGMLFLPATEE